MTGTSGSSTRSTGRTAIERALTLGEPAGVLQLLDRHNRDCAALAARLGVPHLVAPTSLPGSSSRSWRSSAPVAGRRSRSGGPGSGCSSWPRRSGRTRSTPAAAGARVCTCCSASRRPAASSTASSPSTCSSGTAQGIRGPEDGARRCAMALATSRSPGSLHVASEAFRGSIRASQRTLRPSTVRRRALATDRSRGRVRPAARAAAAPSSPRRAPAG